MARNRTPRFMNLFSPERRSARTDRWRKRFRKFSLSSWHSTRIVETVCSVFRSGAEAARAVSAATGSQMVSAMSSRSLRLEGLEERRVLDANYWNLAGGDFSQNWSNNGLITVDDDWSAVPSVVGYRGDDITTGTGVNPTTLFGIGPGSGVVDVNANQTNPNTNATGGVAEFHGTSTASFSFSDNFDGYADQAAFEAVWPSIGTTSDLAKKSAQLSTAQSVSGPNSVFVPVSTSATSTSTEYRNRRTFAETGTLAIGDQLVWSFDFYDSDTNAGGTTGTASNPQRNYANLQDTTAPGGTNQLVSIGLNNNQLRTESGGQFYMARILGHAQLAADPNGGPNEAVSGTGSGAYFKLNDFGVGRSFGWHNLKVVISTDDGVSTDYAFYVDGQLAEVVSNVGAAGSLRSYDNIAIGSGLTNGGVNAAFDNMSLQVIPFDSTVALQGSGTADAPFLNLHMDSTGRENVAVSFNIRDIDGSLDNAAQQVALQYRVGNTGDYTNVPLSAGSNIHVTDATRGPGAANFVTPVTATLPAWANVPNLELRIITTNAVGNDEWVGIDDITVTSVPIVPPVFAPDVYALSINENSANGTSVGTVTATDATIGGDTLTYSIASGNESGAFAINPATGEITVANAAQLDFETVPGGFVLGLLVTDLAGAIDTASATITLNDVNDPAIIGGDTTGDVSEDGTLADSGVLTITDQDAGQSTFQAAGAATTYGSYTLDAAGAWAYTLDNTNAAVQGLLTGGTLSDSFTAVSADGTTQLVSITISGADDPAIIGGNATGDVAEDGTLVDSGALTVTDPDAGQAVFQAAGAATTYGSYTLDAAGNWSYTLDNSNAAVQGLITGGTLSDSFTAVSADGASQLVSITINGANDLAVIGGDATGSVSEDGTLVDSGTLTVTDPDAGQATFVAAAGALAYGSYALDAAGNWSYTLDNTAAAVQGLIAGGTLTDSFTAVSADGATQLVTITINGADDPAVIGGDATGSVSEDGALIDSGVLTVSDPDAGQAVFQAAGATTTYGSYTLDAAGNWSYTLDNANSAVQALLTGGTLSDSFTAVSADGATQLITITINGADDPGIIGGDATGTVSEDGTLVDNGALTISDPDAGQSIFVAAGAATTYGSYTLDAAGNWAYTLDNNNAAVQNLNTGGTLSDSFTAVSADGTTQLVSITIQGVDELSNSVYVNDDWAGTGLGVDPDLLYGNGNIFGADAFASIQDAIDAVGAGATIYVLNGTYDEAVLVNKAGLIIQSLDTPAEPIDPNSATEAIVTLTTGVSQALMDIQASGVTIDGFHFIVAQPFATAGIYMGSTTVNPYDDLTVKNNVFTITGPATANAADAYIGFGTSSTAIAVRGQGTYPNSPTVTITGNQILPTLDLGGNATAMFDRAIFLREANGLVQGNTVYGDSHDLVAQFVGGGTGLVPAVLTVDDNDFLGKGGRDTRGAQVDFTEPDSHGSIVVTNNDFTPFAGTTPSGSTHVRSLMVKNNNSFANVLIDGNRFHSVSEVGLLLANATAATVTNNVFNAAAGDDDFVYLQVTNKVPTGGMVAANQLNATIQGNEFNEGTVAGGRAIEFLNHNTVGATFGSIVIGGAGALANKFESGLDAYLYLDGSTGLSTGSTRPFYSGPGAYSTSTMAPFALDLDAQQNLFGAPGGLELPGVMDSSELFQLEDKIVHGPDNAALGVVTVIPNNLYVTASGTGITNETIQNAIDVANANDTIHIQAGGYSENLTIGKDVNLVGVGSVTLSSAAGGDLVTIDGSGFGDNQTVSIANIDFNGSAGLAGYGIRVNNTASFNNLTVTDSSFTEFAFNAIAVFGNTTTGISVQDVDVTNSTFVDNGIAGGGGSGDLQFFEYNGSATLTNLDLSNTGAGSDAHLGIQFRGVGLQNGTGVLPMGAISLTDVDISGLYVRQMIGLQRYTTAGISLNDVRLGGGGSAITGGFGAALRIDAVGGGTFTSSTTIDLNDTYFRGVGGLGLDVEIAPDGFGFLRADATDTRWNTTLSTGVTPDQLGVTLGELYEIENRILHFVDGTHPNPLFGTFDGFVETVDGNAYITTTQNGNIQRGVDVVDLGGTVNVAAGTYNQSVVVTKNVNLRGAGADVDPELRDLIGALAAETTVSVSGASDVAFHVVNGPTDVTINGFNITGNDAALQGVNGSGHTGLKVLNNFVHDFVSIAVAIETGVTGALVQYNELFDSYAGVYLATGASAITVRDNYIHDSTSSEGDVTLEGDNQNVTIRNNTLDSATAAGVYVFAAFGSNFAGTTIVDNAFLGAVGVNNTNSATLDADGNWWGSVYGPTSAANPWDGVQPTGASVLGNVTFTPWLTDGTDTAPNVSGFQPNLGDVTAPGATAIDLVTDSGNPIDNVTNDNTPTLAGVTEVGALVDVGVWVDTALNPGVVDDGEVTLVAADEADGSGAWAATLGLLADGTYQFVARVTDLAGNASGWSAPLAVTIDSVITPATTIDLPAIYDSTSTSTIPAGSNSDNITNINTPTLEGTAEAGSTVRIYRNAVLVGTVTATAGGAWSFAPGVLADGPHTFVAEATDLAGNVSSSGPLAVTVDTIGLPSSTPDMTVGTDLGVSNSDNVTNDNTPTFTGTAEAGAFVELMLNGVTVLATGNALGGSWTITAGVAVPNGAHSITARVTDIAGNVSTSPALPITIDTVAPTADGGPDLEYVPSATPLTITGTAADGLSGVATAEWQFVSSTNGQVVPNSSNPLTFTPIGPGSYSFNFVVTDVAGNVTIDAVAIASTYTADFDLDGDVDGDDLGDWQTGFGTSPNATVGQGDEDRDGDVDGSDFLNWQRQLGSTVVATVAAVGNSAPTSSQSALGAEAAAVSVDAVAEAMESEPSTLQTASWWLESPAISHHRSEAPARSRDSDAAFHDWSARYDSAASAVAVVDAEDESDEFAAIEDLYQDQDDSEAFGNEFDEALLSWLEG